MLLSDELLLEELLELSEELDDDDVPAESLLDVEPPDSATFRFFPDLKSVSYQPPPFSLKPAAEIFLTSALS